MQVSIFRKIVSTVFILACLAALTRAFYVNIWTYNGALDGMIGVGSLPVVAKHWIARVLPLTLLLIMMPVAVRTLRKVWSLDADRN